MTDPIDVGGITIQFVVEAEQSQGAVSVFRCDVPAGGRVPVPHSHDAFDETIYGLRGTLSFTVDGVRSSVGPGDALFIPRGAAHGFVVDGGSDISMLCVATPGRFGPAYFRDIAAVIAAAGGGPPDREAMMDTMRRHGLTPAV